ncbi:hypothetical protein DXH95_13465 [Sphingorhabdus pulchriflava]|uniref:Uncharacterized protein n=1 Tax=Sphingorhabdus pulchriflava TaxID=2292257 RepID=A0A371B5Q7_9SPHN|nr:hypothetical protein [Sphingorhabdus pulchriflava]RDV02919.1 hypothetical protein DXH95_13465 [Sphingorhabdus pulchriflava]
MRTIYRFASIATLATALAVVPGSAQKTTGPKATYAMDVQTMSGMGMGAMMGGGLGSLLGGGGDNYMLELRLTSATPSPVQPEKGDHFFQPQAKMGKSVPLLGDAPGTSKPDRDYDPNQTMEKPKGRILMFWGCHANAPKGQPFIIDFAKMPTAKMPANMPQQMQRYEAQAKARDANAAWWPNGKSGKQPKSGSSLRGEHRIASAFTPEIKFALVNDYMASLNVNTNDSGAPILLNWNSVPTATGYVAWAMGGMERAGQGGDMVMWTSANNRDFGEGMGWLSPAEVQRQIAAKNVMPPSQTSCQIPAEAKAAAGGMMFGSMNAFGPEENFAFPPKPTDPKAVWNIEWTAKARFRAFASFMTGMGNSGMGGMGDGGTAPAPKKKKPCKGPLGIPIPGTEC